MATWFTITSPWAPVLGMMEIATIQRWLERKALQLGVPGRRVPRRAYGATVGRRVDIDQLVSARAITQRLGYRNVQVVHFWRRTDAGFPDAVFVFDGLRGARLWYWPEVEAWARETGRMDEDGTPRPGRERRGSARAKETEDRAEDGNSRA